MALAFIPFSDCGDNEKACSPVETSHVLLIAAGGVAVGAGVGHMIISRPWVPGVFVEYYDDKIDRIGLS